MRSGRAVSWTVPSESVGLQDLTLNSTITFIFAFSYWAALPNAWLGFTAFPLKVFSEALPRLANKIHQLAFRDRYDRDLLEFRFGRQCC